MRDVERAFSVRLDREGAEWLADEAETMFQRTRDYGWSEIARDLRAQLESKR